MLVEPPLSPDTISNLERGRTRPHRHTLEALCEGLCLDNDARQAVWAAWRAAGTEKSPVSQGLATLRSAPGSAQPTPLIGRELEIQALQQRLLEPQVRLLTLVGPGGVGKTRLVLALLQRLDQQFRDGAMFIDLSALRDASLVLPRMAQELGIHEFGSGPVEQLLIDALRTRHVLLVLDNFEQLLEAGSGVTELLSACAEVKVLVTSREPLRLRWEHLYVVRPLTVPDQRDQSSVEAVRAAPAVALFVDRARAAHERFALTAANAAAIADLCRRLDGLPLALELAAAAVRTLSPAMLLDHLDRQLDLLKGARDAPARQQSLRATLDWSYGLLSEAECKLFEQLSVFSGGCTLESAEAVCSDDSLEGSAVLDLLGHLVDKSLVIAYQHDDGTVRYGMHEAVRQYAFERLVKHGASDQSNARLAAYMAKLAERVVRELVHGPPQQRRFWARRLDQEHDSIRAALRWALGHDLPLAFRLVLAVCTYWEGRWYLHEGRSWLEQVVQLSKDQTAFASLHAKALLRLAILVRLLGENELAAARLVEALAEYRRLGDKQGEAYALNGFGLIALEAEDLAAASRHFEQSVAIWRALDDQAELGWVLNNLARVAELQDDHTRAESLLEESLGLRRELAHHSRPVPMLVALARLARKRHDRERAAAFLRECLAVAGPLRPNRETVIILDGVAAFAVQHEQFAIAARLLSGAAGVLSSADFKPPKHDQPDRAHTLAVVKDRLTESEFALAWDEGQALTPEELATHAMAVLDPLYAEATSSAVPQRIDGATPLANRRLP